MISASVPQLAQKDSSRYSHRPFAKKTTSPEPDRKLADCEDLRAFCMSVAPRPGDLVSDFCPWIGLHQPRANGLVVMSITMTGNEAILGGIEFNGHVDLVLSSHPGGKNSLPYVRVAYYFLPNVCDSIMPSSIG